MTRSASGGGIECEQLVPEADLLADLHLGGKSFSIHFNGIHTDVNQQFNSAVLVTPTACFVSETCVIVPSNGALTLSSASSIPIPGPRIPSEKTLSPICSIGITSPVRGAYTVLGSAGGLRSCLFL